MSEDIDWTAFPVLVVDDEPDNLDAFRFNFRRAFTLHFAESGAQALELLDEHDFAVIVADQRMPRMTGVELLTKAAQVRPGVVGILVTAYTDLGVLIEALNSGTVRRYVSKPWDSKELRVVLQQAIETFHLRRENRRLVDRLEALAHHLDAEVRVETGAGEIIGDSASLQAVLRSVSQVAPTASTVLLRGESGTGKELVARAIHDGSPRADGPFVRVACGALSPGVLESELFGHEKGAFTGAIKRNLGRFELAHGGTLFLDEVGDLPPETQIKLLRVLQEREFERVGGTQTVKVDVRVISATHRDLELLVERGAFREDLYYRLNVYPITVPPLRDRKADIPLLADHFLARCREDLGRQAREFSEQAQARLTGWRGNVRELQNVVERSVIRSTGPVIDVDLIDVGPAGPPASAGGEEAALRPRLDEIEKAELERALRDAGGEKAQAARTLGLSRSTFYYRLRKHGLD